MFRKVFSFIIWSITIITIFIFAGSIYTLASALSGKKLAGSFSKAKTDNAVGLVELSGEILKSDEFRKDIKRFEEDEKVKAILVRIDSPGGAVGASEELFYAIQAADKVKPVVCSLGSLAASGGLYAAMGCRKVVANKGTLTGSIGVILSVPNFSRVLGEVGVDMFTIKSGKFKDTGSPFRQATPEDRKLLQNLVNKAYEQFVNVIAKARNLSAEKVKEFADGRIILGEQALSLGLVDQLGSLEQASQLALSLAGGEGTPELIRKEKESGIWKLLDEISHSKLWSLLEKPQELELLYR